MINCILLVKINTFNETATLTLSSTLPLVYQKASREVSNLRYLNTLYTSTTLLASLITFNKSMFTKVTGWPLVAFSGPPIKNSLIIQDQNRNSQNFLGQICKIFLTLRSFYGVIIYENRNHMIFTVVNTKL